MKKPLPDGGRLFYVIEVGAGIVFGARVVFGASVFELVHDFLDGAFGDAQAVATELEQFGGAGYFLGEVIDVDAVFLQVRHDLLEFGVRRFVGFFSCHGQRGCAWS
jgi:hypothetical protein